ncbi:MAG: pilus assembly protein [Candidatus Eremiobacteraeota bacterium]|nr:pilus assembly protein [Candidatus Eremiobacteraeota bacterium]
MTARSRGQALTETALFMPLILLTLWGIIWAAQYGVLSERVQGAIRYSGLISNQINPFTQYSMYVLYNSLGTTTTNSPIPVQTCNAPSTDAMSNSGSYPGPTSGPFWQATAAPPTLSCANGTNSQTAVYTTGLNQPAIALSNTPVVSAQVLVPNYLQSIFGGLTQLPASGQLNFIRPADMSTMLNCHTGMQNVLGPSLQPTPAAQPALDTLAKPTPIAEPMPSPSIVPSNC